MEKLLRVLGLLISEGPTEGVSVQQVAKRLDLPPATVHRLLALCVRQGMAAQLPNHRYTTGPGLLALGLVTASKWGFKPFSRGLLSQLAQEVNQDCYIAVRVSEHGVFVERSPSPSPVRVVAQLFEHLPLHCGASRKVLLAYCEEEFVSAYVAKNLERFTPNTITEPKKLMDELARIRSNGYATSNGERLEGVVGVAAPIFGPRTEILAAATVLGPQSGIEDIDAVVEAVTRTASGVSDRIANALRGEPSLIGDFDNQDPEILEMTSL